MPVPETRHLMAKIVLVGEKAVGKTSLIRRYVTDAFDDRYLITLGAKVTKKVVDVRVPERDATESLSMNIWDIMGQASFRELAKEAYFHGARGIIAVSDLTRKDSLESLREWTRAVTEVTGPVALVVLGNKKDLLSQIMVTPADVAKTADALGGEGFLTSAKTGENVEAAFRQIATKVVRAYLHV